MQTKEITYKELLDMLPGSWAELTVGQFEQLMKANVSFTDDKVLESFNGQDNVINVISVLISIPVDQLESLPLYQVMTLAKKLEYLSTFPEPPKKPKLKLKDVNKVSYDSFVKYIQVSHNPLSNLSTIIHAFQEEQRSIEDIKELPAIDAIEAFFLSRKHIRRSLKRSLRYSIVKNNYQILKNKVKRLVGSGKTKK